MKHRVALCVGLTALGVAAATSTQAQVYVGPPRVYAAPPPMVEPPVMEPMVRPGLPPNEILMIVRASGLRPLTRPARRGGRYLLLASDNMGGQLRVVVNAHNGRIVRASPAYDPRFADHPVRRPRGLVPMPPREHAAAPPPSAGAPPAPEVKDSPRPPARTVRATPPHASVPQAPAAAGQDDRSANKPAVARPERTPLPRPRPTIASNETAPPAAAPAAAPQAAVRETSPEAEQTAATSAPAAPSAAQPAETQMVPVAPLD
ncbi:MAG: hypothetical protein GEU95_02985 [Rhizobiales bacterium]|nr:hypothetical protein [Hyphomicrobiales bacterium]